MFQWLREIQDLMLDYRQAKLNLKGLNTCHSCEILKVELAAERREKEMLLRKILSPNEQPEPDSAPAPAPFVPKHRPWRVIQQELEAKDRVEAERILKEFKEKSGVPTQPIQPVAIPASRSENVAAVERELGING